MKKTTKKLTCPNKSQMFILLTNTCWQIHFISSPRAVFVAADDWFGKLRHQNIPIITLYNSQVTRKKTTRFLHNDTISNVWQWTSAYNCTVKIRHLWIHTNSQSQDTYYRSTNLPYYHTAIVDPQSHANLYSSSISEYRNTTTSIKFGKDLLFAGPCARDSLPQEIPNTTTLERQLKTVQLAFLESIQTCYTFLDYGFTSYFYIF